MLCTCCVARATHRLVNDLDDAGLQLGHDRGVTGGHTVLARATRDDHLKTQGGHRNHQQEEVKVK